MDSIHDGFHGYLCSGSVRVLAGLHVTLHDKSLGRHLPLVGDGMPVEQDFVQLLVGTIIYPTCL
jgi:hypothetical protein